MKLSDLSGVSRTVFARLPGPRHAAAVFLAFLLGVIFINHFIFDDDPNRCQTLARSGKYREGRWLPDGCHIVPHGDREINDCSRGQKRKIVIAGDAPLQDLFWTLANRIDKSVTPRKPELKDLQFSRNGNNVELEFIWDEWLNGTKIIHRVEDLADGKSIKPLLTIVGAGKSFVERNDLDGYQHAVANLAGIAYSGEFPKEYPGSSKVFTAKDGPGDLLLFVPAQLSQPGRLRLEQTLDGYLDADARLLALEVANPHISVLWSFNQMLAGKEYNLDMAKRQADVVLNMRCNADVFHWPPNQGICCGTWRGLNWIQGTFLWIGLAVLPGIVLLDTAFSMFDTKSRTAIRGFAAFMAAISLQRITDRTHIFEQVTRFGWNFPDVAKMLGVSVLFGIFTIRMCRPAGKPQPDGRPADQPFLPREQTDEWKGWMQLLIIIYHYNKAWEATWFWEIVRIAVSSYLFLTGFGHTLYYLQKKDYSFKRFVNVMIRTNLLPCTLAYVMNTRWLLYYYMPLSTFWFAVAFATLAIGAKYNENTLVLLAKIAASAAAVDIFINTKDLAETVYRLFKITCRISFDVDEFFGHRVAQDKYIVYVGMLTAIFYIWLKDVLSSNKRHDFLSRAARATFPSLKYLTVGISAVAFATFWWWLQVHVKSQSDFTKLQPYISFIPILTFTVLRNAHPILRNWHSMAFAWLGRYSAEMYVMQNHIWLAGDQESILRTGLFHGDDTLTGDRWRDLLFVTPLYLIACSVIGDATGVIANWFIQEREVVPDQQDVTPEVEIGLLSGEAESGDILEKIMPKQTLLRHFRLPWPPLKWRVFFVLAGMWFLNWVSWWMIDVT